jgi:chromosome segregation ATPase
MNTVIPTELEQEYLDLQRRYSELESLYNELVNDKKPLKKEDFAEKRLLLLKAQNIQLQRYVNSTRADKTSHEELLNSIQSQLLDVKEAFEKIARVLLVLTYRRTRILCHSHS